MRVFIAFLVAVAAGVVVVVFQQIFFSPPPQPAQDTIKTSSQPSKHKVPVMQEKGVDNLLSSESTTNLISSTRLLAALKPAFPKDRLSIIKEMAPKLGVISGSELLKVLNLIFTNQRLEALPILLRHVRKPLTDDEFNAVLELFHAADVPRATLILTSKSESQGMK
jgi:hypothetical protein